MGRVILGSILTALVVFIWGAVAWTVLQPYNDAFLQMSDEAAVSAVLNEQLPESGAYFLPPMPVDAPNATEEEKAATMDAFVARHERGPLGLILFHKSGEPLMEPMLLVRGFAIQAGAAFLMALALSIARVPSFFGRYGIVLLMALFAVTMTHAVNWNFLRFPDAFTLVLIADGLVAWGLGGFVMAIIVRPKHAGAEAAAE